MTTHALRREAKAIELSNCADFMAGITVHNRVGTNQRKSILMLVDVVNRNLPAVRVVAQFTLGSVLAAMKIRVAVLTLVGNVAEIQIGVAIHALHF